MVKFDFMAESPIFGDFRERELREIARSFDLSEVRAGERIFSEGDPGDALYIVASGKVRITKRSSRGVDKELSTLGPNAIMGEMAILESNERSATATAESDAVLLEMSRDEFERMMKLNQQVALKFLLKVCTLLSHKLRKTSAEYIEMID